MIDSGLKKRFVVRVDENRCIGCGACENVAEMVFKVNNSGTSQVLGQTGSDEDMLLAAQSCPANAIEVKDIETGKIQWPKAEIQEGGELV